MVISTQPPFSAIDTPRASTTADGNSVVIIVAGFTGLAAAYELGRRGVRSILLERKSLRGGLAAGYEVGGQVLERFYYHWLGTDRDVIDLVKELDLGHNVLLYSMADSELLAFAIPHIKKMLPDFNRNWVLDYDVWRADYAQPVITPNYSKTVPGVETPLKNFLISTMAQVYPQNRGTNYAIKQGREIAKRAAELFVRP